MIENDFDFVNTVAVSIGGRAEREGIEFLSSAEQNVFLVWWANGIIENGGFRYFYEGACNTEQVAVAFEVIGLPKAAQACRETMAVFPAETLAGGFIRCQEWLNSRYSAEEFSVLFRRQDEVIWALGDELSIVLASYIRQSRAEIAVNI